VRRTVISENDSISEIYENALHYLGVGEQVLGKPRNQPRSRHALVSFARQGAAEATERGACHYSDMLSLVSMVNTMFSCRPRVRLTRSSAGLAPGVMIEVEASLVAPWIENEVMA